MTLINFEMQSQGGRECHVWARNTIICTAFPWEGGEYFLIQLLKLVITVFATTECNCTKEGRIAIFHNCFNGNINYLLHVCCQCTFAMQGCTYVILDSRNFLCIVHLTLSLRNLEGQCCIHKGPPIIPILRRIDPIPRTDTYFCNIHSNIVLPSTLRPS